MNEAEKVIKMIQAQKGTEGVIVINSEGITIDSNVDYQSTLTYSYNIQQLLTTTKKVLKDLDHQNELTLLDIETEKNNILISTANDYLMISIRNPGEGP